MKTYIITVSRIFPKTHKRAGEKTQFTNKIFNGSKIHTIRSNYELWTKRINEVKEGKALISLRFWSGRPYNSKQIEFSKITSENNIDVQKIQIDGVWRYKINDGLTRFGIEEIANNDGLSVQDFKEWFKNYDYAPMAIIHFTGKRY